MEERKEARSERGAREEGLGAAERASNDGIERMEEVWKTAEGRRG